MNQPCRKLVLHVRIKGTFFYNIMTLYIFFFINSTFVSKLKIYKGLNIVTENNFIFSITGTMGGKREEDSVFDSKCPSLFTGKLVYLSIFRKNRNRFAFKS